MGYCGRSAIRYRTVFADARGRRRPRDLCRLLSSRERRTGACGEITARTREPKLSRPVSRYLSPCPATRCAFGSSRGEVRRSPHVGKRRAVSGNREDHWPPSKATNPSFSSSTSFRGCCRFADGWLAQPSLRSDADDIARVETPRQVPRQKLWKTRRAENSRVESSVATVENGDENGTRFARRFCVVCFCHCEAAEGRRGHPVVDRHAA